MKHALHDNANNNTHADNPARCVSASKIIQLPRKYFEHLRNKVSIATVSPSQSLARLDMHIRQSTWAKILFKSDAHITKPKGTCEIRQFCPSLKWRALLCMLAIIRPAAFSHTQIMHCNISICECDSGNVCRRMWMNPSADESRRLMPLSTVDNCLFHHYYR